MYLLLYESASDAMDSDGAEVVPWDGATTPNTWPGRYRRVALTTDCAVYVRLPEVRLTPQRVRVDAEALMAVASDAPVRRMTYRPNSERATWGASDDDRAAAVEYAMRYMQMPRTPRR